MCVPYIYRIPDPQPHKRGRNGAPGLPHPVKIQPPNVTFSAEFSPRVIYRTPSNSRRASTPARRHPSAPHPTPEMGFVEAFAAEDQVGERKQSKLDEEVKRVEEGRAALPQQAQPPAPAPLPEHSRMTPLGPTVGPSQPPLQRPPSPPVPVQTEPQRLETQSSYSYVRRPPPGYRPRQRSRSSSASSISRRSFETLSRKVNTMLGRIIRLERWREERDVERRSKRVRWDPGPGQSEGRQDGRERSSVRDRDAEIERERLRERERWDWEGGGLGRR